MSLEYAILGFLSEGDRSGYDLKTRCFDDEANFFWTADQAQVYRTLERLESNGLVSSSRVRQNGKPDRKIYRLTRTGQDALSDWLAEPHSSPRRRDPLLLQLRFAEALPDDVLLEVLANTRESYQSRLEGLRLRLGEHSRGSKGSSRRDAFARMTIEAALAGTRANIDWIDDCIETLREEMLAQQAGSSPQRPLFGLPQGSGGDAK